MAKVILMVVGGLLLLEASAGRSFGQIPQLGGPPACACDGIPHQQEHFDGCCEKFMAWLTYQPIKKPGLSSCCCCKCDGCCQPPLFTYFPCMGCGIAMRPCPTCDGSMPAAHILSIQEPGAKREAQDSSARILNIEGDKFVVIDRTGKPLSAPAPSLANAAGVVQPKPFMREIVRQGSFDVEQVPPLPPFQKPELATSSPKATSAQILDIQGQATPQSEKDGPNMPFSDR